MIQEDVRDRETGTRTTQTRSQAICDESTAPATATFLDVDLARSVDANAPSQVQSELGAGVWTARRHDAPSQWTMVPLAPTAHASSGLDAQTASSCASVSLGERSQRSPSQCMMVPCAPTAQTSVGPVPPIASRRTAASISKVVQLSPSQR